MKIASIKLEKNNILGDIFFDFRDELGNVIDNIIIAGENGAGKTTLLEIIYDFTNFKNIMPIETRDETRTFCLIFDDKDISKILQLSTYFSKGILNNEIIFIMDYSAPYGGNFCFEFHDSESNFKQYKNNPIYFNEGFKNFIKSIYSTTEINFNPNKILGVTSKNIDEKTNNCIRSSSTTATEITQLLVDIKALDDADLSDWVNENSGQIPPDDIKKIRIKRFENAFNYIFPVKRFEGIKNVNGSKNVIFKEYDKEMPVENLSSGEKQIVFRGGFLLKDKKSSEGAIILIDEPEISLHPDWQMKIVNYFRKLFINEIQEQTSQIFFVTHSPFIIHNSNRVNDKTIILKKDEKGKSYIPADGKFYNWTNEEIVREAFSMNIIQNKISNCHTTLLITEGKTDWKHLKKALEKLKNMDKFSDLNFEFLEFEDEIDMSDSHLKTICEYFSIVPQEKRIICMFDRDNPTIIKDMAGNRDIGYKYWGHNVYSFCIPTPSHRTNYKNISIEFYYTDEEIHSTDNTGKQMLFSNEVEERATKSCTTKKYVSKIVKLATPNLDEELAKKIYCQDAEKIVDEEGNPVALSKAVFANNIYNDKAGFNEFNIQEFEKIFENIKNVIDIE
ncbi:AAA family ATPase [Clostridium estertheticum]|uniref:AAA family ATPase n=1 Tax=Clostridium estertheticum TaxID=238834 RepID=UPI001C0D523F|nr:ATP-binding protein [Clostridium estertheticum]MBU3171487.1 AAA family ATPase [Clostridium estertheticum]